MSDVYKDIKGLGTNVSVPQSPDEAVLEAVSNPQAGELYLARFTAPEFTSICPVTGQPDFAHFGDRHLPRPAFSGVEITEVVLGVIPKSRCISRRLYCDGRQTDSRCDSAEMASYLRLLVSARRYSN